MEESLSYKEQLQAIKQAIESQPTEEVDSLLLTAFQNKTLDVAKLQSESMALTEMPELLSLIGDILAYVENRNHDIQSGLQDLKQHKLAHQAYKKQT